MTRKTEEKIDKEHKDLLARNAELSKLIQPLSTAEYEVDVHWHHIEKSLADYGRDYGMLDLAPDFQRGHVWTADQQRHFVENVLRGVVSTDGMVIKFNCPNWHHGKFVSNLPDGLQIMDGLQRLTAVKKFLAGEVKPFGLSLDDLNGSSFSPNRYRFRVAVHCFTQRSDLLKHYLTLNTGGTPHSQDEISRVNALLAQSLQDEGIVKN